VKIIPVMLNVKPMVRMDQIVRLKKPAIQTVTQTATQTVTQTATQAVTQIVRRI